MRYWGLAIIATTGASPADVGSAAHGAPYGLAFLDGDHTPRQLLLDFAALFPFLAERAIVVRTASDGAGTGGRRSSSGKIGKPVGESNSVGRIEKHPPTAP